VDERALEMEGDMERVDLRRDDPRDRDKLLPSVPEATANTWRQGVHIIVVRDNANNSTQD